MIATEHRIERLRQERLQMRLRQMEKGGALPGSIAVADVTHTWDGWLFGGLCLAALWPVFQAMGWF
jgi:hypothetical protein